jgi:hypothetical protein
MQAQLLKGWRLVPTGVVSVSAWLLVVLGELQAPNACPCRPVRILNYMFIRPIFSSLSKMNPNEQRHGGRSLPKATRGLPALPPAGRTAAAAAMSGGAEDGSHVPFAPPPPPSFIPSPIAEPPYLTLVILGRPPPPPSLAPGYCRCFLHRRHVSRRGLLPYPPSSSSLCPTHLYTLDMGEGPHASNACWHKGWAWNVEVASKPFHPAQVSMPMAGAQLSPLCPVAAPSSLCLQWRQPPLPHPYLLVLPSRSHPSSLVLDMGPSSRPVLPPSSHPSSVGIEPCSSYTAAIVPLP